MEIANILDYSDGGTFNFADRDWRAFAADRTRELGIHPNQVWHHGKTRCGALVVMKSRNYEEFALSKAGLDYLVAAHKERRINAGHVVLACWRSGKPAVVASKPAGDVAALLADVPPRDGPLGPYWWVRADLTPDGNRVLDAAEVPF